MAKKTKLKSGKGGTVTAVISPEVVFCGARSLVRCREDVSMETVLGHPIGLVPAAIFHHADGTMRKTNKAELGHQLEARCGRVSELPECNSTATVYTFHSFEALAVTYFRQLLTRFQKADTVVEVFDRYDEENMTAGQDLNLPTSSIW